MYIYFVIVLLSLPFISRWRRKKKENKKLLMFTMHMVLYIVTHVEGETAGGSKKAEVEVRNVEKALQTFIWQSWWSRV
jgi:hypothetical protein